MRVAFVTAEYPPKNVGGSGISSQLIVEGVRAHGVDVDVFVLTGDEGGLTPLDDGVSELPAGDRYPLPTTLGQNVSVARHLPDLADYDVVHCYSSGQLPALVARSRVGRPRVPVLATYNNLDWVCIDYEEFLRDDSETYSLREAYAHAGTAGYRGPMRLARVAIDEVARRVAARADAFTVQTTGMRDVLARAGYSAERVTVVSNLLDPSFLATPSERDASDPSASAPARDRKTLLFVGRLVEKKGVLDVVDAFCGLPASVHDEWTLAIYGDGPLEAAVRARVDEQSSATVTVDSAPYDALPEVYRRADAFVHASRYNEPFSRTWLEAMASRTPIVCSRNPSSEAVLDGVAAFFDPFDPADLRAVLARVLSDPDERAGMTRCGTERCRDFTAASVIPQYLALYERLSGVALDGRRDDEPSPAPGLESTPAAGHLD